jgi:surface antigen
VCVGDYVDTGSWCVSPEELKKQKNNIYAGKIVATRYDNSTRVSNGFYIGQCTYWAAKRRPDIFPYVSATKQTRPFRGNANAWLRNAQAAWLPTGSTPAVWAIAVDLHGWWWYGHVAIVKEIRADLGLMLIEDMNGASGRWYVDHRWDTISKYEWYIY